MHASDDPMHDPSFCPHIDRGDSRCSHRFTLAGAHDVFSVCCGGQHGCVVFHRLNMEQSYGSLDAPKAAPQRPLRPFATPLTVSAAHDRRQSIRNLGA